MTHTSDTALIDLGNQLAAAIRAARDALDAIPEVVMGDAEQDAIAAAMAPADTLMSQILPAKPNTLMGFIVLDMARRWSIGEAFGDDLAVE